MYVYLKREAQSPENFLVNSFKFLNKKYLLTKFSKIEEKFPI